MFNSDCECLHFLTILIVIVNKSFICPNSRFLISVNEKSIGIIVPCLLFLYDCRLISKSVYLKWFDLVPEFNWANSSTHMNSSLVLILRFLLTMNRRECLPCGDQFIRCFWNKDISSLFSLNLYFLFSGDSGQKSAQELFLSVDNISVSPV